MHIHAPKSTVQQLRHHKINNKQQAAKYDRQYVLLQTQNQGMLEKLFKLQIQTDPGTDGTLHSNTGVHPVYFTSKEVGTTLLLKVYLLLFSFLPHIKKNAQKQ